MVKKESMGALIDAVYAIAATLLALESPAELSSEPELVNRFFQRRHRA